jgi:hypothetical protein
VSNREDLAWAAGFMDGEGSFYTGRRWANGTAQAHVHIAQNHPESLSRFCDAVGLGRVYGPYARRGTGAIVSSNPRFEYFAYPFEHTQAIAAMLWPWLGSAKKEQAKRVLQIARGCVDAR